MKCISKTYECQINSYDITIKLAYFKETDTTLIKVYLPKDLRTYSDLHKDFHADKEFMGEVLSRYWGNSNGDMVYKKMTKTGNMLETETLTLINVQTIMNELYKALKRD